MGDYGLLINQNTKIHRRYFNEMVKLLGVQVLYRTPLKTGTYTLHGEFRSNTYSEPIKVGCIFSEHEDQKTSKMLGWDAELVDNAAVIHVPYDLEGLQVGCLFEVPSAYDNAPGRLFRVTKMSTKMIYPASVACEIVPEYTDTSPSNETEDFTSTDFNVLWEG